MVKRRHMAVYQMGIFPIIPNQGAGSAIKGKNQKKSFALLEDQKGK